jgi:hypothetical protein
MCHGQQMHHHHRMCWRSFITNEEKIQHLESYKTSLQHEIKGVEETIDKLKKAN